jgi:hypothetical protein
VSGFSSEAALINEVRQRLFRKFGDVPQDRISSAVNQAHDRFAHSKVRDFVPLLVERRVSDQLSRDVSASTGSMAPG